MQSKIPLPPKELILAIGGSYREYGDMRSNFFIKELGLKKTDHVLDVGCGCGRIAIPLTNHIEEGTYTGFDIMGDCVSWCQSEIQPIFNNFVFEKADVYNKHYNPKGTFKAKDYIFPYKENYFDFIYLSSVFTHMLPEDMEQYLREIKRVLKKGGKVAITYFIISDESNALVSNGKSVFNFQKHDNLYVLSKKDVEAGVGFTEEYIQQTYLDNNLKIEKIFKGSWCGREEFSVKGQDLIFSIKT